MYFKKMLGKKCYLSPIDVDDYAQFTEWFNDLETTQYLSAGPMPVSVNSEKEFLQELVKTHCYSIIDLEKNVLIGNCGLVDIDNINQTAEIGIFIGIKEYLNKGFGSEAMSLLIDYSFKMLNIRNIMLRVYSYNERAINCYTKVGFKKIGNRRNSINRNLNSYDIIYMDMLPDDFYKTNMSGNSK